MCGSKGMELVQVTPLTRSLASFPWFFNWRRYWLKQVALYHGCKIVIVLVAATAAAVGMLFSSAEL